MRPLMATLGAGAMLFALGLGGAASASTPQIGVAAAIKNDVRSEINGQTEVTRVGANVYQNQLIETGEKSTAQLLFLDQTSLSIGPNAAVKLDRFVYDPDRTQGDVVLEASRGAFRFISGSQDPASYTVKTPVATIGVRGTVIDFILIAGDLVLILDEGSAFITLEDGTVVELKTPGDYIVVKGDGTVIGPNTWEGAIDTVISAASFPLYGFHFAETPWEPDGGSDIDYADLTEELASRSIVSIMDDIPDEGEGEGEGGYECDHEYYYEGEGG